MRYPRVLWSLVLLPLLLFAQSAEAARISFATENCGTPPLLGLEFGIDENGTSVLLNSTTNGCPTPLDVNGVIPGELVGDDGTLYGTSLTSIDLTITSTQILDEDDFEAGNFFSSSLPFTFSFASSTSGGGVLSITFDTPIQLCFLGDTGTFCPELDLLLYVDNNRASGLPPLIEGTTVTVTAVNDATLPEPATLSLLGIGLAVAAVRRRRTTATKGLTSRASSAPGNGRRT